MKLTMSHPSTEEYMFKRLPNDHVSIIRCAPRIGRNDPCPCQSGKKYKACHLRLNNRGAR
jgi:preprotein translocase subunit SecA